MGPLQPGRRAREASWRRSLSRHEDEASSGFLPRAP